MNNEITEINDLQKETLLSFALGYSIRGMARYYYVSSKTIRNRLKRINKNYPEPFERAAGCRNAEKRLKFGLQHSSSLDVWIDHGTESTVGGKIKKHLHRRQAGFGDGLIRKSLL